MEQVNVSEFKAVCLRLMEQVRQTGEPIEVLKNGVPLVIVSPVRAKTRKSGYGSMRDTLKSDPEDLISPIQDAEWNALI
jgi:antitoxin (DNA-binding transcriptional repressor) of toxin-antitoxin stability system